MTRQKSRLPRTAQTFLTTREGRWSARELRIFHRWMSERNLVLADLTPAHIEHFFEHERAKGLAISTMHVRHCLIHKYLFWLGEHGHLRFVVEPPRLRHMRVPLPTIATDFLELRGHRRYTPQVRNLHDWLQRKRIALDELTPAHLEAFVKKPIGRQIVMASRNHRLSRLEPYLRWLHERGAVGFRFDRKIRKIFPLPQVALAFIDTLRPVLRTVTCSHYIGVLRAFHAWLAVAKLDLKHFDRPAAERWLKSLADRGLVPTTRCACIFMVRRYLDWLVDRGELDVWTSDLLRIEDLPKLPSYLPRPFPVDADRALKQRFLQCRTVYGQALFLMRCSGVRIGELVKLEPQCLERDLRGNAFLKVPLGKLDNERLVPLTNDARDVLLDLKHHCPHNAEYLISPELSRDKLKKNLNATLKQAAQGLDIPGAVVSHRLRHTYATELLNAGLPLVTIMKLLGHRSFRMTMRYAAIAQQTIVDDYHTAMSVVARKYETSNLSHHPLSETTPERQALDLISALRRFYDSSPLTKPRLDAIIKRIYKLRDDILALTSSPQHS